MPSGETLKLHLRPGTTVTFRGNTIFGYQLWEGPLVEINGTDVVIQGEDGAILDGQGSLYWDGLGEWGTVKPKFFTLQLHNSIMSNIHVLNNPVHCVLLADSSNVTLDGWVIDASDGHPVSINYLYVRIFSQNLFFCKDVAGTDYAGHNTDGFDIWNSTNVVLSNSMVQNQDDCVAIRCGKHLYCICQKQAKLPLLLGENIVVEDMVCYGGHGLSISVGFSNESYEQNVLRNVIIKDSILQGGENAIHIKTHVDGTIGLIQNITYQNIEFQGLFKICSKSAQFDSIDV